MVFEENITLNSEDDMCLVELSIPEQKLYDFFSI